MGYVDASGAPLSDELSPADQKRLEFYRSRYGPDLKVTFVKTQRPETHYHQNTVTVRTQVRPADDPLNRNRLEAEAVRTAKQRAAWRCLLPFAVALTHRSALLGGVGWGV